MAFGHDGGRDRRGRAPPLRTFYRKRVFDVRADVGIRPYERAIGERP